MIDKFGVDIEIYEGELKSHSILLVVSYFGFSDFRGL
jgi:hypothetical protein